MISLRTSSLFASALVSLSLLGCGGSPANSEAPSVGIAEVAPPPPPAKSHAAPTASAPDATSAAPAASARPAKPDGGFDIATADSTVEFTGSKVTGRHDGKFEKFSGWVYIDGDRLDTARLYLEIDVASVKTDAAKLDEHLKQADFFNVAEHPIATFQLTELTELRNGVNGATHTVTGNLKMRGVEKSVAFPAKVTLGKDEVKTVAEFSINRTDWGINYAGRADDLIRDAVIIRLAVKAKR
jgi:polyisoprenoid-binding protein YceI